MRSGRRGVIRRLFRVFLALVLVGVAVIAVLWILTPAADEAPDHVRALASEHQSSQLEGAVPTQFAAALLATEDSRFYRHHGIDTLGLIRGGFGLVTNQETGGSTVNQQLAKMLFFEGAHPLRLVPQQMTLALKLDLEFSKAEVLQMYADVAYFGHGFYGLRDAACGYFGAAPDDLTWSQASLLAGLVQAPSSYDPFTNPDLAAERQQHVVDRLVATGAITADERQEITQATWDLAAGADCS